MDINELLEPFVRMLDAAATPAVVRSIEHGGSAVALWDEIAVSGFLDVLVAEEHGGAGLSLADIEPLIEAIGARAVPLPVAETMVARALLASAGVAAPEGPIALVTSLAQTVPCGLVAQAAQIVQQKMPQPPVDPAVQKTFEAAMAEVKRKTDADKMSHDREMQKLNNAAMEAQGAQQLEQTKAALEQQNKERDTFVELQIQSARDQAQRLSDELRGQVELMKNEQDNRQHQHTEIVKNIQDNQTQLQIAMERGLADVRNAVPEQPDMSPVIKQLNDMLSRVEKQKSEDSLSAVMQGLQGVIQSLNRPKMIVHDDSGKPVGIQ